MEFMHDIDMYAVSRDWSTDGLYGCYRWLSRVVSKAPRKVFYADYLRNLDVGRLPHIPRAMLKVLLSEVPASRGVLDPGALAVINATPPVSPAVVLNDVHPLQLVAYKEMGLIL